MRLRHIEQAWNGTKIISDLRTYLSTVIFMFLDYAISCGAGIREAKRAVNAMLCRLKTHSRIAGRQSQTQAVPRVGEEPSDLLHPERNLDHRLLPTVLVGTADLEFTG